MGKLEKHFKLLCYLVAFILGLIVVVNAWNLGKFFSRQYNSSYSWSTDLDAAVERAKDFRTAGTVLALVSGCGLVIELSKRA